MKFDLYQTPQRKALMLSGAALKLAELGGEEKLSAHVNPGAIAILKGKMTAREMVSAIGTLSELASDITVKLALACGGCDDCGLCEAEENDSGDDCGEDCFGLDLPEVLMNTLSMSGVCLMGLHELLESEEIIDE